MEEVPDLQTPDLIQDLNELVPKLKVRIIPQHLLIHSLSQLHERCQLLFNLLCQLYRELFNLPYRHTTDSYDDLLEWVFERSVEQRGCVLEGTNRDNQAELAVTVDYLDGCGAVFGERLELLDEDLSGHHEESVLAESLPTKPIVSDGGPSNPLH